ncbi:MAG: hypothetical protein NZM42_08325 [Gemmatales bacterium]|nr:hypothetical protein [Gemmatales bacterium]
MTRGATILTALALVVGLFAQSTLEVHRDGFEGATVAWQKGLANATHRELAHERSTQTAHSGRQSEHIRLHADKGTFIHYYYDVGKAALLQELTLSVWVKANRPGAQLLARLVLPREREPQNLDRPLTTLLRGDTYELAGRWQRLELRQLPQRVREAQTLLRQELQREVNFDDAYVDQIVLNVYSGPGLHEIWIDDLEVGPIWRDSFRPAERTGSVSEPKAIPSSRVRPPPRLELLQECLYVNGRAVLPRLIRDAGTPLAVLREAGFTGLLVAADTPEARLREAADLGFLLVPSWPNLRERLAKEADPTALLARQIERFPVAENVLCWHLGSGWSSEQAEALRPLVSGLRHRNRLLLAIEAWDGLRGYSRQVDILGTHRWPLHTALELRDYHTWLMQRRRLADPGTYLFTWVQTHAANWMKELLSASSARTIDPEQVRILTWLALASGYRGLAFWADDTFTDPGLARARLLQLAIVNLELEIVEPFLATARDSTLLPERQSEFLTAMLRSDAGLLTLVVWTGRGGQFVPGQPSSHTLQVVVPAVPEDAQAWEVTAGQVRALRTERVGGGVRVTIPEFALSTLVVFTSDLRTIERLQAAVIRYRHLAAQWAYDLGVEQLARTESVVARLQQLEFHDSTARVYLDEARRHLERARTALLRAGQLDYREAWSESQTALALLRLVRRRLWEQAIRLLDHPVCLAYAVSFDTLPEFWQAVTEIRRAQAGPNMLEDGGFEVGASALPNGWQIQHDTLDAVSLKAQRSFEQPKEGRACLLLEVRPQNPQQSPAALERTYLAAVSRPVALQPGSWVRISFWLRIPDPIQASVDGFLVYDSAGGEPLAVRLTNATPWRKITLFRKVPASGFLTLTLALTGMGRVFADDVRVEPLLSSSVAPTRVPATE